MYFEGYGSSHFLSENRVDGKTFHQFYESNLTLRPKPEKEATEKYHRTTFLINIDANTSKQILANKIEQYVKGYHYQFSSVAQSCSTLCNPMNCSMPGLPVHHQLLEFTQTHNHQVGDAISHLILCRPLLLLPPIPPSIRVFSNESTLCMRWPKYWSFSFNISPFKEHP